MKAASDDSENASIEGAMVALNRSEGMPDSAVPAARTVRIALVDDEESMHQLVRGVLRRKCPGWILDSYTDGRIALSQIPKSVPDMVLMDISMPGITGIGCTKHLRTGMPDLPVLILSGHVDPEVLLRVMMAGACGCLCKPVSAEDLVLALKKTLNGSMAFCPRAEKNLKECFGILGRNCQGLRLTDREKQIINCFRQQKTDKQISETLRIGIGTVHFHVANILKKLNVHSRAEAVAKTLSLNDIS
jgi:NarL family two-component system response regulator LiaR